jgi:ankyrin repeat protein
MIATWKGHRKVVMALLKAGASARAALPNGRTALSLAKSEGHMEVVSLLLEKA